MSATNAAAISARVLSTRGSVDSATPSDFCFETGDFAVLLLVIGTLRADASTRECTFRQSRRQVLAGARARGAAAPLASNVHAPFSHALRLFRLSRTLRSGACR